MLGQKTPDKYQLSVQAHVTSNRNPKKGNSQLIATFLLSSREAIREASSLPARPDRGYLLPYAAMCIAWITFSFAILSATATAVDRLEGDFGPKLLESKEFDVKVPEKGFDTTSGFHYLWMGESEPFKGSHTKAVDVLIGDFDILLRFKVNHLGKPQQGYGAGVLVRLEFADVESTGISVQRQARSSGEQVVSLDRTRYNQAFHDVVSTPIQSNEDCSGLRLQRKSSKLFVAYSNAQGTETQQWEVPVSNAAVLSLGFHLHSGGSVADMDVIFQNYVIVADEIVTREEYRLRTSSTKKAVGGIVALALIVSFAFRLRRRGDLQNA